MKFAKVMFLQVSVCPWGQGACVVAGGCVVGGHAWLWWGVRGCGGACVVVGVVCMVVGGMRGCWGCAWLPGGMHGCRGHVWLWGVCMVAGGHVWLLGGGTCGWGACMVARARGMHRIQWGMVNEQAVCILLECILVFCHAVWSPFVTLPSLFKALLGSHLLALGHLPYG